MGNIFPKDDLMKEIISDAIEKEDVRLRVYATKKRFKKLVTVIEGLDKDKLDETAKGLKSKLACGGTVKDGLVILQGNHILKIKGFLVSFGYDPESITVVPGFVK
ncbi:MAG: stress response translation initiation inhibitor YciH [Candidatus Micrarchaeia archaeon]